LGGAPVFNWHEIRKRKRKGSKTRPHSSPDPSCGREESRGGAVLLQRRTGIPQKNSLPRRPVRRSFSGGGVQISFQDFRQKMFELRSKNTAKRKNTRISRVFSFCGGGEIMSTFFETYSFSTPIGYFISSEFIKYAQWGFDFLQKLYTFRFLNTEYSRSCALGPFPQSLTRTSCHSRHDSPPHKKITLFLADF
jgi:hypothetical protein